MAKDMSMALRCDPEANVYCVVLILDGDEIYCQVEQSMYEEIKKIPTGDQKMDVVLDRPLFGFEGREHLVRLSLAGEQFEIPVTVNTYENIGGHGVIELT